MLSCPSELSTLPPISELSTLPPHFVILCALKDGINSSTDPVSLEVWFFLGGGGEEEVLGKDRREEGSPTINPWEGHILTRICPLLGSFGSSFSE